MAIDKADGGTFTYVTLAADVDYFLPRAQHLALSCGRFLLVPFDAGPALVPSHWKWLDDDHTAVAAVPRAEWVPALTAASRSASRAQEPDRRAHREALVLEVLALRSDVGSSSQASSRHEGSLPRAETSLHGRSSRRGTGWHSLGTALSRMLATSVGRRVASISQRLV